MRVLLTFTGFHDPYVPSGIEGEMRAGPILTVVAEHSFESICFPRRKPQPSPRQQQT